MSQLLITDPETAKAIAHAVTKLRAVKATIGLYVLELVEQVGNNSIIAVEGSLQIKDKLEQLEAKLAELSDIIAAVLPPDLSTQPDVTDVAEMIGPNDHISYDVFHALEQIARETDNDEKDKDGQPS